MSVNASPPIPVVQVPYQTKLATYPAPKDDWGYYEGRPTPSLSPLMPFNTVPWFHKRWMFDKLQEPVYGTGNILPIGNINYLRNKFVAAKPINKPSFIKDKHLITIRKQIEQLFAPLFAAHLIVTVEENTMHHPPCYYLNHGRFQKSWWIGDGTGGEILSPGHYHWMRIGSPSGKLRVRSELSIDNSTYKTWGGSVSGIKPGQPFRSSYGNYYVLNIEYGWTITEYWRKMVLEDLSVVQTDYQSVAPQFLMPMWGSWDMILQVGQSPTGRAIAFAIDLGQMWQPFAGVQDNGDGTYFPIKVGPAPLHYLGPGYGACTRPYIEGPLSNRSGGGSDNLAGAVSLDKIGFIKFAQVAGFNCGLYSGEVNEVAPHADQSFPSDIIRDGKVVWEQGSRPAAANDVWSFTYNVAGRNEFTVGTGSDGSNEYLEEKEVSEAPYKQVAHCLGCDFVPTCHVTIMDFNKRVFRIPVNDCEMYYN